MVLGYLNDIWIVLAGVMYAIATFLLYRGLDRSAGLVSPGILAILGVGACAHGFAVASEVFAGGGVTFGLDTALSLAAWVVVVLFIIAVLRQPLATLGLIVIPYALIDIITTRLWSAPATALAHAEGSALAHTVIAIIAFGLLALAFFLAIVLLLQEWHLQNKRSGSFFHSLPPLQTMEQILFQLIGLGFLLLTIALVSGAFFASEVFGQAFLFNHHVVLSIIAWIAFGLLMVGRLLFGWRGRLAAIWTISSFVILALSYFGTRFVLEILLDRKPI